MSDKKWEEVTVDPKGAGHTYRLRVPGGYLYRTTTYRYPEKHAQWDRLLRVHGSTVEAMAAIARSPGYSGFNPQWATQAQEIVTQTSVFVPKAQKPEHLTVKKAAKAAAKVRKTFEAHYANHPLPSIANVVKLDDYRPGDVVQAYDGQRVVEHPIEFGGQRRSAPGRGYDPDGGMFGRA